MLQCPKCKEKLQKKNNTYVCENRHSYDIAKRGYCNLLLGNKKNTGDDVGMVQARTAFLNKGYYERLQSRIIEIIQEKKSCILIDAGCGEGYYTNKIKEEKPDMEIYGFDLSKVAVDEASKQKSGVNYFVASVFELPLSNQSADFILSVFAPINETENARILKDYGFFLKVEPGPKHLEDLKAVLYDDVYDNEEAAKEYVGFQLIHEELLDYEITLTSFDEIKSLFQMTPYYWKTSKEATAKLYALNKLKTRIQFHIELYQKKI